MGRAAAAKIQGRVGATPRASLPTGADLVYTTGRMSLMRAIATVGSLTLLSRFAGFARHILTAAVLGAGPVADAFFAAPKLPNFFRPLTAQGASQGGRRSREERGGEY